MKIDMHCHSYYSRDGYSSPEALIRQAQKKGLNGIALTDHNNTKGWQRAQKIADELGIILIQGEEIKIKENNKTIGEILAYFIEKEINPKGKTLQEVINEIHNQNGLAVIAHPHHWKKPFKRLEECKNIVDAVEAFNARSQSKKGDALSLSFAQKNNLPITAGSDCHNAFEIGSSYIEVEAKTIDEFKKELLEKRVKTYKKQIPFFLQILSPIAKLIHFFIKPK